MMKQLITLFSTLWLALAASFVASAEPNLSGLAAFEQLRKEYYIGALYLGWPGHDAATILAMPGKRQMELRITADRWPALRFAQMWNQAITINNDGTTLNANAMDIVAFTSILKGDLVEGDQLIIDGEPNAGTRVTLNNVLVLHSKNAALFNLILNSWIGSRPPTSDFKRDILTLPTSPAGTELMARYEAVRPSDARKKAVASWGIKPEPESTPVAVAAAPVAAKTSEVVTAKSEPLAAAAPTPPAPTPTSTTTPTPKPAAAPTNTSAPTPASKPAVASVTPPAPPASAVAAVKTAIATPTPAAIKPSEPVSPPKPAAEPAKTVATTTPSEPAAAAESQPASGDQAQGELYDDYLTLVRRRVLRHIEYPRRSIKDGTEGMVMLRIRINREGAVVSSDIMQSADDLLDAAAQSAVTKSAPFPKPSEKIAGTLFEISIPVVFKLTN